MASPMRVRAPARVQSSGSSSSRTISSRATSEDAQQTIFHSLLKTSRFNSEKQSSIRTFSEASSQNSSGEPSSTRQNLQLNDQSLPDTPPAPEQMDTEFLKALHHVLLEIHVEEGAMVCANCGHVYPISNGIPNMLLQEHEL
ncbi:SubName: Full=Related to TRM112-subunit of an adoMet-dependent tRNA methyltransferase (MTase) complex {ECO:0000313/EMBL:CCA74735.1} [Serendipita indica DSM 11827]|nr:SubName: Full=Related to TRM112-subunit of an adoMet-dependent tRNA methyltransferase (MTase) complex {ECO:0000313/EMBL:CCA74735.1} [Serendipita indica DSM 11827]